MDRLFPADTQTVPLQSHAGMLRYDAWFDQRAAAQERRDAEAS